MGLFQSRFNKPSSAAIHTNGFADAADQGNPSFGATSPETFSQRQHVDRNRQHIERFQNARIHRDYRSMRPTPTNIEQLPTEPHVQAPAKPDLTAIPRTTGGFREPSSRGFNPFR